MAEKKSPKSSRDKVLQELRKIIKDLPEDGLQFLLEQAHVMQYNMKVDELNKARQKINPKTRTSQQDTLRVEKGLMGNSMILVIKGERKIMGEEEMYALVTIAHKTKTKKEGAERLYRWLDKERDDILLDAGIDKKDPVLGELYSYLRKHFTIKK